MKLLATLLCLCALSVCSQTEDIPIPSSTKSLLFVGNSLTYTNNLPALVTKIAKDSGLEIKTTMLAFPDYALEDHLQDGQLQKLIASGEFDFVILQQGPSSQEEGRTMLLRDGAKIKAMCSKSDTELAFFMVWPARSNYSMFDGVILNYTDAATQTSSILCPVGNVWKNYMDSTGDFSYYGPDQFHPSLKGSETAAQIIFQCLIK